MNPKLLKVDYYGCPSISVWFLDSSWRIFQFKTEKERSFVYKYLLNTGIATEKQIGRFSFAERK
jgi:hypothetical protein